MANASPPITNDADEDRLRRSDELRWICSRFVPSPVREAFVATSLLDLELKRALAVSEPMIGKIRLQWWRDAIASGAGAHPVLSALSPWFDSIAGLSAAANDMLDAVDDLIDDHLDAQATSPDVHLQKGLELEAALWRALGLAIARSVSSEEKATLSLCGRAVAALRSESGQAGELVAQAREAARMTRSALWPVLAYAGPVVAGVDPARAPLRARWAVFRAVALERF